MAAGGFINGSPLARFSDTNNTIEIDPNLEGNIATNASNIQVLFDTTATKNQITDLLDNKVDINSLNIVEARNRHQAYRVYLIDETLYASRDDLMDVYNADTNIDGVNTALVATVNGTTSIYEKSSSNVWRVLTDVFTGLLVSVIDDESFYAWNGDSFVQVSFSEESYKYWDSNLNNLEQSFTFDDNNNLIRVDYLLPDSSISYSKILNYENEIITSVSFSGTAINGTITKNITYVNNLVSNITFSQE